MKKIKYLMIACLAIGFTAQTLANTLFQTGTIAALMSGLQTGSMTFEQLTKKGDFGLGTANGLSGEMVEIDGKVYLSNDAQGNANSVPLSTKTPFAMTTRFRAKKTFTVENITGINALQSLLNKNLPSENLYYAIKVTGLFNTVTARSVVPSNDIHAKLTNLIEKNQRINQYKNIQGTLVIFKSPAFSSPISVAGYHTHFISADRKKAGHVYDVTIANAEIAIDPLDRMTLQLPKNTAYLDGKIDLKDSLTIREAER